MKSPFFILGFQRSGTTLLRLMLDNHPEVAIPLDVVGLWERYYANLGRYNDLQTVEDLRNMVNDLIREERIRLWEIPLKTEAVLTLRQGDDFPGIINAFYSTYAYAKGKMYWGDKDPGNMTRVHLINRWFPSCKVIHIMRDGRDACLSQLKQDFGFDDVLPCAAAWREEVWWVRCVGQIMGPSRYLELRYEDLVEHPEKHLREICDFLGIAYSGQMLAYYKDIDRSIPQSKQHIWPLIRQPPQKDNANRWKSEMSHGVRVCFEKRAGDVLRELGYEVLPRVCSGGYIEEMKSFARIGWKALRTRATRALSLGTGENETARVGQKAVERS